MLRSILVVVALIGVAGCAPRDEQPPAIDTATPAPVTPRPDTTVPADTMARDTASDTTTTR